MKQRNFFVFCFIMILLLLFFMGCSGSKKPELTNELHFSLTEISDVTISYDEESVSCYEADGDELIIKEYMTKDSGRFHANVKQKENRIHISEGGKPFFKMGFSRYIEVYLPASYTDTLTITTTDGTIDLSNIELKLSELHIETTTGTIKLNKAKAFNLSLTTTSGTMDLGNITAETITLDSTRGNISCDELAGNVTYTSTSGNADIISATGSGSYNANNSGRLNVVYTKVTGDLSLFNKNDDINLTLPADLEFEFEATTKNGSVSASFQKNFSSDGRTVHGTVGTNPSVTVKTETNNGNIEVLQ